MSDPTERSISGSIHRYPSSISSGHSSLSSTSSPVRTLSGLGSPRHQATPPSSTSSVPIVLPSKVPPPPGVIIQASRDKDGFFVNQKKKNFKRYLDGTGNGPVLSSSPEEAERKLPNEFVPKEGGLTRNPAVKGTVQNPRLPRTRRKFQGGVANLIAASKKGQKPPPAASSSSAATLGIANFHSNMKQSFRYRKIALRKEYEQPLYAGGDETDDSGDESDAIPSYCGRSSVPRPLDFPLRVVEFPQEEETLMQSDSDDAGSTGGGMQSHTPSSSDLVVKRRANLSNSSSMMPSPSSSTAAGLGLGLGPSSSLTNSYSKVTIAGPRLSSPSAPGKRPVLFLRSGSQTGIRAEDRTSGLDDLSPAAAAPRSLESSLILQPPQIFGSDDVGGGGDSYEDSYDDPPELDLLELPARPPSDGTMYSSCNSLDDILVEPPEMFNINMEGFKRSTKRKLSRTKKVNAPAKLPSGSGTSETVHSGTSIGSGGENHSGSKTGIENNGYSIPKQGQSEGAASNSNVVPDRDSTESSDTGYTSSSASPGYAEAGKDQSAKVNFQDGSRQKQRRPPVLESNLVPLNPEPKATIKRVPSLTSLVSVSSEVARCYIPLVFHSAKAEGAGVNHDPNLFCIQVCLVENSDELIKVRKSEPPNILGPVILRSCPLFKEP